MRTSLFIFLIVLQLFPGCNFVDAQPRRSISLNENWILTEAKTGFDLENFIPDNLQNRGEEWFKATMP